VTAALLLASLLVPGVSLAPEGLPPETTAESSPDAPPSPDPDAGVPAPEVPPGPPTVGYGPVGLHLGQPPPGLDLRMRGVLQLDAHFFPDTQPSIPSTFFVRRARLYIEGAVTHFVDFRLMPDFGQGKVQLLDAFVDVHIATWLNLRVGKMKAPFGLERLQAEKDLVFIERGLQSNLAPDRDIGASLYGGIASGLVRYELGIFDGAPDGASVDGDVDSAKDVMARIFACPLRPLGVAPLRNFGIGAGVTYGREFGSPTTTLLPSYVTDALQTFFTYRTTPGAPTSATTTVASGAHLRIAPQAYEYWGPFGFLAEYIWGRQDVLRGTTAGRVVSPGWQLQAEAFLTGESASYESALFEPLHRWGAIQLAARYNRLSVGENAFPTFADPSRSAQSAQGWSAELNWYLTWLLKFAVAFDREVFQGALSPQDAALGRVQLVF
jgi:phosphate-selective porin OprO and OprP